DRAIFDQPKGLMSSSKLTHPKGLQVVGQFAWHAHLARDFTGEDARATRLIDCLRLTTPARIVFTFLLIKVRIRRPSPQCQLRAALRRRGPHAIAIVSERSRRRATFDRARIFRCHRLASAPISAMLTQKLIGVTPRPWCARLNWARMW